MEVAFSSWCSLLAMGGLEHGRLLGIYREVGKHFRVYIRDMKNENLM